MNKFRIPTPQDLIKGLRGFFSVGYMDNARENIIPVTPENPLPVEVSGGINISNLTNVDWESTWFEDLDSGGNRIALFERRTKLVDGTYTVTTHALSGATYTPSGTTQTIVGDIKSVNHPFLLSSAEFARPANTTAYGSVQSINNSTVQANVTPMEFTATITTGGSGKLIKARLITNNSNFPIPIRLWLYTVSPTNISADGSQFLLQWTNRATRIGFVDFPPLSTEGAGSDSSSSLNDWVDLPFKCAAGSTKLYGVLETRASGTATPPTSGQLFFVELMFEER